MSYFNIRVYGLLVNDDNKLLVSDEFEYNRAFTKFPGGGLELGEGTRDALIREFWEECGIDIEVREHIHTTDLYVPSAFNDSQVIAIYYRVTASEEALDSIKVQERAFDFGAAPDGDQGALQVFRWIPVGEMKENDLAFEIDREAWRVFVDQYRAPQP